MDAVFRTQTSIFTAAIRSAGSPNFTRHTSCSGFTLTELLVVIAIIAMLMSLLIPTVRYARDRAITAQCSAKLRQMGVAHALYQGDNNGFLADNSPHPLGYSRGIAWALKLAPYLGLDPSKNLKPNSGETMFTCPLLPKGTFYGNWPSYHVNGHCNISVDMQHKGLGRTLKMSAFLHPSAKVYLGDCADIQARFKANEFAFPPFGNIGPRHQGKANMLFLDGHVATLGAPPLPNVKVPWSVGGRWLLPDSPPPEGL